MLARSCSSYHVTCVWRFRSRVHLHVQHACIARIRQSSTSVATIECHYVKLAKEPSKVTMTHVKALTDNVSRAVKMCQHEFAPTKKSTVPCSRLKSATLSARQQDHGSLCRNGRSKKIKQPTMPSLQTSGADNDTVWAKFKWKPCNLPWLRASTRDKQRGLI